MVKKFKNLMDAQDLQALPTNLRESAQQIWMAGLSAFAKAQSGGNKVFEALMKEGQSIPQRTRQAAREQVDEMAAKAGGTWDKLEQVFETRVARAMHSLGVPTHEDIDRLSQRVAELSALVQTMQPATVKKSPATRKPATRKPDTKTPATKTPATRKPAAKKPAAKKPAARKASA